MPGAKVHHPQPAGNATIIDFPIVQDVERLVLGIDEVNIHNFASLATTVEAVVLHETLIYPRLFDPKSSETFPFFHACRSRGIVDLEWTAACSGLLDRWVEADHNLAVFGSRYRPRQSYSVLSREALEELNDKSVTRALESHLKSYNELVGSLEIENHVDLARKIHDFVESEAGKKIEQSEFFRKLGAYTLVMISIADAANAQFNPEALAMPFAALHVRQSSLSTLVYRKIARHFGLQVERLLAHQGSQQLVIPPLMTILLDGCRTRDEIPEKVLRLRDDFTDLRGTLSSFQHRVDTGERLGDQLDALDELDASWEEFLKRSKSTDRRVLHKVWQVVKDGSPLKIATGTLDELWERERKAKVVAKLKGFVDMWEKCRNVRNYAGLVRRVFGRDLATRRGLLREFTTFAEFVSRVHGTRESDRSTKRRT